MKFWVGVTDPRWFNFHEMRRPDEVNFWQPSARTRLFANAPAGMPFLFKLKGKSNAIAGGGFFVTSTALPVDWAWESFGVKNGAESLAEFTGLLGRDAHDLNPIRTTVLSTPFFWEPEDWIANPMGFLPSIQQGKYYDTETEIGAALWSQVDQRIGFVREPIDGDKYGEPILVRPRLGQGAFRVLIADAYQRRCAVTGENTLEVLEAAHINPFAGDGTHTVQNGLLLRADFHKLFDRGLLSVTPDYYIRVSPAIHEKYFNGKVYYSLDRKPMTNLPADPLHLPNRDALDWHYRNVFLA